VNRWASAAVVLSPLLLSACAGGNPQAATSNEAAIATAVEPSLRAAAAAAEANNDWKGAVQHWRTLYSRHPEDKSLALALARDLRYAGEAPVAADVVQQAIARSGRDPALVAELGKAWLASGRQGLALKTLEEATTLAPGDWDVHSAYGVALDGSDRYAEAQAAYARALVLSPDNPVVLNNLGLSQAMAGKLDDAVATLKKAEDQPQASLQVRQNLALLLTLQGDVAAADRIASRGLPPEMVRNNAAFLHWLAANRSR
jgi:Flp pilus assembly protein TadD